MSRHKVAAFVAILFHLSGLIGILFTPYREWFIRYTPLNLGIMAALLLWCQEDKKVSFFLFVLAAFLAGMGTEMIGVHTARLFGSYRYGEILGPKWNGVPWLIGVNWFVIVYCSAASMHFVQKWLAEKLANAGTGILPRTSSLLFLMDGALLAVFFDWMMEPAAVKLGYWQWETLAVPVYNYLCWFLICALLLLLLQKLRFSKANYFAVHLFIIQLLFFLALRIYL